LTQCTINLKMKKEFKVIADLLPNNTRVLDVGCGDGSLMNLLEKEKNIEVRGLELEKNNVQECIYKGLPVIQGDAETELYQFPNQSFDYVVLSQTLQAFYNPDKVLKELLRIGKSVIVSIPNFGYWKVRTSLLFFGKMPMTKTLPYSWYNTPNLHMCSIKDLFNYCDKENINIRKVIGVNEDKISLIKKNNLEMKNFFSKLGIFLIG
jgi:methionine biosynthesis protein MetW